MSKVVELTIQMTTIDGYLSGGEDGLQFLVLNWIICRD